MGENMDLRKLYEENGKFKEYCDRALNNNFRNYKLDEFLELAVVKEVAMEYEYGVHAEDCYEVLGG